MKISKGVEWACHAAVVMSALPEDKALRAESLARYHEVPSAYMAKQLQALSRAGIVKSSRGARGGYRLAKPPLEINLWDITSAIEGHERVFKCTEIRQNGPCPAKKRRCNTPCAIAASFYKAEAAFRNSLKEITLMQIAMGVLDIKESGEVAEFFKWIEEVSVSL